VSAGAPGQPANRRFRMGDLARAPFRKKPGVQILKIEIT
jgi:hypothetical protein